jgi:hypothetical protein
MPWGMGVIAASFLTSSPDRDKSVLHCIIPRYLLGRRLDVMEKRKSLTDAGNRTPVPRS